MARARFTAQLRDCRSEEVKALVKSDGPRSHVSAMSTITQARQATMFKQNERVIVSLWNVEVQGLCQSCQIGRSYKLST